MTSETVFTYGAPALKYGPGAAEEIGYDLVQAGAQRVLVLTDAAVAATGWPRRIADSLVSYGLHVEIFDGVHIEPTDVSMRKAVDHARGSGPWDAFVAVGGGSTIDTAKVVNLLTSDDGELMDYVNPPIGGGRAPGSPLKPLVAVPTTSGTGSESTTVCVLDVLSLRVKTGISHPRLRPTLAVVDPRLTVSAPPGVTAATGMDILCHAAESYTAKPYTEFERKRPEQRVPYCGANPIADMFAERALMLLRDALPAAVENGEDVRARENLSLAATFAGMGFGNAGVHIPHANAYPIAGQVRDFVPDGYPPGVPLIPHGMAVSLTAPEAFRFTFPAAPERHLRVAELLGPDVDRPADDADHLPTVLRRLLRRIGIPNGIGAVGYSESDVDGLVEGTVKQQRLLATAPRTPSEDDLAGILRRSVTLW